LRPLPESGEATGLIVGFGIFDEVVNSFRREGFAAAFAALLDEADPRFALLHHEVAPRSSAMSDAGKGGHHVDGAAHLQQNEHVQSHACSTFAHVAAAPAAHAAAQQDVSPCGIAAPWTRNLRAYLSTLSDDGCNCFEVLGEFVGSLDEQSMEEYFGAAEGEQQLLSIQERTGQYIETHRQLASGGA
jgi:hypothetical protein